MQFHPAVWFGCGESVESEVEVAMFAYPAASWYQSNQCPKSPCEHCGGVVRHEHWCITCDALVQYAYGAVLEPEKLTLLDRLVLHALGVVWTKNVCSAACKES
jgi:hypothetical protein